jgi:hypothetical protein
LNIKESRFYSNGSLDDALEKCWIANNEVQGIPTNKFIVNRQLKKIKELNSGSTDSYNEVNVTSLDSNVDYEFDSQVFDIINEYLTNPKIIRNRRMCGFVRLYATGFIEEFSDKIEYAKDLVETRTDGETPHNILDDIKAEIALFQEELGNSFAEAIKKYPELKGRELEIKLIGTNHQLFDFNNRMAKVVPDTQRLTEIMTEVVGIRNRFLLNKEKKAGNEFLTKYPNYVALSYYNKHQSEFSDDLFRRLPKQCAIAIQSNNYSSCIIS